MERIRQGAGVTEACEDAIWRIVQYVPAFTGAVVAVTPTGEHGASCHGLAASFPYSVRTASANATEVVSAPCVV